MNDTGSGFEIIEAKGNFIVGCEKETMHIGGCQSYLGFFKVRKSHLSDLIG